MPDDDQPITRADLRTEIDRATVTINAATAAAIAAAQADTAAAITAAEQRAAELARDMQTEILRGIEAFARGNFPLPGNPPARTLSSAPPPTRVPVPNPR